MSSSSPRNFDSIKHVHIIGVCGTLMGAFASFLKRSGKRVTGSDQNVYPPMSDVLRDAGVELMNGYRAENLSAGGAKPDLVVIGNVISAGNAEARAAIDGGYSYSSLPEAMERFLLGGTRNLVVAGTHGKTTTSSLLAHVLASTGRDPSYFIGGVSQDLKHSFHISESGGLFVLEGDEYDTAFWDKVPKFNHYLPDDVILTSVEYDHADIYPDFAAVVRAFQGLIERVRPGGRLIACWDYDSVQKLAHQARGRGIEVVRYATREIGSGGGYWPGPVRAEKGRTVFEVLKDGLPQGPLSLGIPGMHNVLNALAVWIECRELGIPGPEISRALASFRGVKRRQEERGEPGGVLVIDDFAHHPTAVRETLLALKAKYPGRRLLAVFEPRSATSRRKVFQSEYAAAFGQADLAFLAQPYDTSKIAAGDQFSSEQLVKDLLAQGHAARVFADVESGVRELAHEARAGDVIAVLSNGGFGGLIVKLLGALAERANARSPG